MKLHKSLRAARVNHGMSGASVAKQLEISPAAYLRYERGEVVPGANIITKLSDIYSCSTDLLLKGESGGVTKFNNIEVDLRQGETLTLQFTARVAETDDGSKDNDNDYLAVDPSDFKPKRKQAKRKKAV